MNKAGRAPALQFLQRSAEIFQDLSVNGFYVTFRIRDRDEARNAFDRQPKPMFARAHRFFGTFAVLDVFLQASILKLQLPLEAGNFFKSMRVSDCDGCLFGENTEPVRVLVSQTLATEQREN